VFIGLISDTHGLLRAEALEALRGVGLILHAGDVGSGAVLRELRRLAPVRAVCGNVDDPQNPDLEATIALEVERTSVRVSHGHELGSPTPEGLLARYDEDVIVFGHTHRPLVHRAGRRLVVNPGAAGPRRFNLKPSVARLTIAGSGTNVQLITLSAAD
jgi:putative phosphoesterase